MKQFPVALSLKQFLHLFDTIRRKSVSGSCVGSAFLLCHELLAERRVAPFGSMLKLSPGFLQGDVHHGYCARIALGKRLASQSASSAFLNSNS
jgi:hypothetical protein